jgi:DNA-binding CsgD family transcriptional regulator
VETHTLGIIGRDEELAAIGSFLDAEDVLPATLLLEGEAGIGKTTVWEAGIAAAAERGWRTLRARPAEAEAAMSFIALSDLLGEALDDVLSELPSPQRRALEAALMVADAEGAPPDRRAVAAATLGSFRALAGHGPLLVAVDDIQWLDAPSATALEFAVWRLRDEPVALLFARRRTGSDPTLGLERAAGEGLRRAPIGPLSLGALGRVVHARLGTALPRPVLRRIHELSGGNPFFALELARARDWLEPGRELPPTLDALVRHRLAALPADTRRALAAAAAASQPTVGIAESAAAAAGALAAAEAAHVIVVERGQVHFTHPLLASGAYALSSAPERRRVHARLAEAIADPEERARHLALSASGPDSGVAAALDSGAASAHARGAPAAAAELLEEAAALTPADRPGDARRRLLDAGLHHFESGDSRRARQLFEQLAAAVLSGPERARILVRLARVRSLDDDLRAAAELCLQAVEEAGNDRHVLAQAHARVCSLFYRLRERLPEAVAHARAAASLARELGDESLLADALGDQVVAEAMLGLEEARATLAELLTHQPAMESVLLLRQPKFSAGIVRIWWEEAGVASTTYEELLARGREIGDESSVPYALVFHAQADLLLGEFERARRHADEGREHADQAGQEGMSSFLLALRALADAHLGAADATRDAAERALAVAARVNSVPARHFATAALGLLELSLGRPQEAAARLGPLVESVRAEQICEPGMNRFALDLVEALVELGRLDEAVGLLDWYQGHAERLGRRGALANALRCRAVLAAARGEDPLPTLDRALAEHEASLAPFDRARTLLAQGAALRRAKRKRDARRVLEEALAEFERLDAAVYAERTRGELARIGGRVAAADELTPTEERVSQLVSEGLSNREVAAAMFLTTKTVEFHLRNVFRKLGIRSRTELVKRRR